MGLMQISRRADYGLRAVIYLADQEPGKCSSIAEIAKRQGVPKKFLEKIIQDLVRRGLISSKRGSTGGYMLARPADAISFCDVIEAIEGPISVNASRPLSVATAWGICRRGLTRIDASTPVPSVDFL